MSITEKSTTILFHVVCHLLRYIGHKQTVSIIIKNIVIKHIRRIKLISFQ